MTRYLYLVSHAYSGSTLISFLLGAHPEIATVGEMHGITAGVDVARYPCSCGTMIRECGFWAEVASRLRQRGIEFSVDDFDMRFRAADGSLTDRLLRAGPRGPLLETVRELGLRLVPAARRRLADLLERNRAFAEVQAEIYGAPVVADTSKRAARALFLRRIPSLDLGVVHLVRDVRAVVNSAMKNSGASIDRAIRTWIDANTEAESVRRRFPPDRWLTLRYEDVCARPEQTLAGLFRFAGLEPHPSHLDFRAFDHHIIGNRMRLGVARRVVHDERWRDSLSIEQQRRIARLGGLWARRYGYELGGDADETASNSV